MAQETVVPAGISEILRLYKVPIALGAVSLCVIAVSFVLLVKSAISTTPITFSSDQGASGSAVLGATEVNVDIEGAVVNPGVYSIPPGSRVEDAIVAAGGLADTADTELFAKTINRAIKVVDGAKIYVPRIGNNDTSHINSPLLQRSSDGSSQNGLVNINTASESELDSLPGVGPVTAQKIISNRPYQTLEELVSKKAIGQSLYGKIKDRLSL